MTVFRTVVRLVAAEPFRPFRIRLTNGRLFKIVDPHDIFVGRSSLWVRDAVGDRESPDGWQQVFCILVESVSLLDAQPSAEVR